MQNLSIKAVVNYGKFNSTLGKVCSPTSIKLNVGLTEAILAHLKLMISLTLHFIGV